MERRFARGLVIAMLVLANCAPWSRQQAHLEPVDAAIVRKNADPLSVSAYTTRSSGRVVFDGRVQYKGKTWELSPHAYGAQRFSLPDSELVSVDPAAEGDLSTLSWIVLGGILMTAAVVAVVWIGLGGSSP